MVRGPGLWPRPGISGATPERKPTPGASDADYETPEKEAAALSARALSPKIEKRPAPKADPARPARKNLSTPAKPPKGTRERTEALAAARAETERASRDIVATPRQKPPRSPRPASPAQRAQAQAEPPLRNPFRADTPMEEENGGEPLPVEEMWDVSVAMAPLSLRTLPDVENIAPSLRNALRFLTFNKCPADDWRLQVASESEEASLAPFLPEPREGTQLTLVLDLDETLMHCQKNGVPDEQPDMCLHFTDSATTGYVRFRPFAVEMLEVIATWGMCEVVVFTASTQAYADAVLNVLDPTGSLVQHRLYRQHCVHAHGGYFKDLRALGRPLSRTVLVDNSPVSLAMNPANGIPIKSWLSNPRDTQLRDLLGLLHELVFSGDSVQPILEERFQLPRFLEALRTM